MICLAIETLGMILVRHQCTPPQPADPAANPAPPRLLSRLPLEKRGPLISQSVQDHYVSITTTAGSHLVLIRRADAITEASPTPGLQVHRSHWVALDQVKAARRTPEAAILTPTGGAEIPVARSRPKAVLAAGLLAAPASKAVSCPPIALCCALPRCYMLWQPPLPESAKCLPESAK